MVLKGSTLGSSISSAIIKAWIVPVCRSREFFVKQKKEGWDKDIQICVHDMCIYNIYIYTYILQGLWGILDFLCCCWCKHLQKKGYGRALKAVVPGSFWEPHPSQAHAGPTTLVFHLHILPPRIMEVENGSLRYFHLVGNFNFPLNHDYGRKGTLPETDKLPPETLGLVQMSFLLGPSLLAGAMLVWGGVSPN